MKTLICVVAAIGGLRPLSEPVTVRSVVLRAMHDVEVPAQETGPLVDLPAQEGRNVKAGEVLARIDDSDARSAVAEATADLEVVAVEANSDLLVTSAETDLEAAARNLQRALDANRLRPGSVLEFELDRLRLVKAQNKLAVAQANQAKKKAQKSVAAKSERVVRAKERLRRHAVQSPISGSIVESRFERGEWVEAGEVVARVVQINRLKAEGLLEPSQAAAVMAGSPVTVQVLIGERTITLAGTVTFVSSEAHARAGNIRFRAVVENPGQLARPGLKNASLTIHRSPQLHSGRAVGSPR